MDLTKEEQFKILIERFGKTMVDLEIESDSHGQDHLKWADSFDKCAAALTECAKELRALATQT